MEIVDPHELADNSKANEVSLRIHVLQQQLTKLASRREQSTLINIYLIISFSYINGYTSFLLQVSQETRSLLLSTCDGVCIPDCLCQSQVSFVFRHKQYKYSPSFLSPQKKIRKRKGMEQNAPGKQQYHMPLSLKKKLYY